ncbi:TIGR00269 family protein [archaeon]|nr:TIGR00269 family protein [archaeon]
MRCSRCKSKAVSSSPVLCRKHFIAYFEKKVADTIKKHKLIPKNGSVCVATSGGKDSTGVLYLVKKLVKPKRLLALAIDEGILGYRENTLRDLRKFCNHHDIDLKVVSFKEEFGSTLDEIISSKRLNIKPCNICGTLRRYLLNKHSKGFDCVVTGHNLDDESQAVMMNLFRHQIDVLSRLGPSSGIPRKGFVQRVKPLYFCSEKASLLYSLLMDFEIGFNECPYVVSSYRAVLRDVMNGYESRHKGTKLNTVRHFLSLLPRLKRRFGSASPVVCGVCGEPSANDVCNACRLAQELSR